jgi:hypothetical protein
MEPRCPDCCSPEIDPPLGSRPEWRCRNCGAFFELESALVTFAEAETFGRPREGGPSFVLDRVLAEAELRDPDGAIAALSPRGDAVELRGSLPAAEESGAIQSEIADAALRVMLPTGAEPHPVLVVDPGAGPELVGPELALRAEPGEDPVTYSLRWLDRIVSDANATVARSRVPLAVAAPEIEAAGHASPRYRAICMPLFADGTIGPSIAEARALSVSGVLAEMGERIESSVLDPTADALDLTVSWVEYGEEGQG